MIRRNRIKQKLFFIIFTLGIIIIYNEYLIYEVQSWNWAVKDCHDCIRLLLVADPQIIGEKNENYLGSSFARWDSDKYLEKTFAKALRHSEPNVIIFLGDLMDEGHIAPTSEFIRYKYRWDNIFYTPDHIMTLYLPGDNDIGGEEDYVSSLIHDRFKLAFTQPDLLPFNSLLFFKVNKLINYVPKYENLDNKNTTNIVLSHMPLLFTPGFFSKNVIEKISPQIIFTAHNHKGMHVSFDTIVNQLSRVEIFPIKQSFLHHFELDNGNVHEFQVPTCSYRMGTQYMGYGLAYIDVQNNSMDFTILWLPNRFAVLISYLVVMLILILVIIYYCCWRRKISVLYT